MFLALVQLPSFQNIGGEELSKQGFIQQRCVVVVAIAGMHSILESEGRPCPRDVSA